MMRLIQCDACGEPIGAKRPCVTLLAFRGRVTSNGRDVVSASNGYLIPVGRLELHICRSCVVHGTRGYIATGVWTLVRRKVLRTRRKKQNKAKPLPKQGRAILLKEHV